MPLTQLLEYTQVTVEPCENITQYHKHVRREYSALVERIIGEPLLLNVEHLPVWQALVLFTTLYPHSPEILVRINPEITIVISSVYLTDKTIVRPESVKLFLEMFTEPAPEAFFSPEKKYYNFDSLFPFSPSTLAKTISQLTTDRQPVSELILSGATDPATALIYLSMWRPYAKAITYTDTTTTLSLL
jgi:hypothetical protein